METELKDLQNLPKPNMENNHNHQEQLRPSSPSKDPIDDGKLPLLNTDRRSHNSDSLPSTPSASTMDTPVTAEELEEMEKKYAAYVRHDVYGRMGRGRLPVMEKVLLGLALVTLVPIRVILAMTILVIYYLICRVCTLFLVPNQEGEQQEDYAHLVGWRRDVIVWSGRFLSRTLLFTFGFYWIPETDLSNGDSDDKLMKQETDDPVRPGAIISNHVSYLDILYHMSTSFPSFVAKRSVAKLPLIGLISKCLGCVFVQRESKSSDFKGVSGVVTERVKNAHEDEHAPLIMLFPEGTTTNGDFLLPFKTGAFLARVPLKPVILRYPYQRFSPAWDSMSGKRHVILLLCQFANHMEVTRLPVYCPSKEEKDDPKLYASNVRRLMASQGNLILSDIGLAEKRVYHAALNGNNSLPSAFHRKTD